MRRLVVILFAMLVGLGAALFVAMNTDKIVAAFEDRKPRVVVVLRDLPEAYPLQNSDVALRPMDPKDIPPGALVETSDRQPPPVLSSVIGRAGLKPIRKDSLIFADTLYPMDVVERLRATTVLVARNDIAAGTQITADLLATNYKKNVEVPAGSLTGSVGEPVAAILSRVPTLYARNTIPAGSVITFIATTPDKPGEAPVVASAPAMPKAEPLDPAETAPRLPPEVFAARLASTPEALAFDRREEYEAIVGRGIDRVDLFVGGANESSASDGIETHRRALKNLQLYRYAAPNQPDAQPTYWVLLSPDEAHRLAGLRREGAQLSLVPAGGALKARAGSTVLCREDTCYRSLADASVPLPPDLGVARTTKSVGNPTNTTIQLPQPQ